MYYVVYGFLWLVSLLPLRVLYIFSDIIFVLVFYVFGYRKKVVLDNLRQAFPDKSERERLKIAGKFYRNLVDTFVETIKLITVSRSFIRKRFTGNWEVINALKSTGRNVEFLLGHNFNWEWGNSSCALHFNMPLLVVYMPIKNKIFDRLFLRLRSRYGAHLLRATQMAADFKQYRDMQYIIGLAADQNPGHPANAWWFQFLGKPAPFVKGPAKMAIRNDAHVVFGFIQKPRRGYYELVLSQPISDPKAYSEQELTKKFVTYLEQVIREHPDMWLWSHRRWKHEWDATYGPVA